MNVEKISILVQRRTAVSQDEKYDQLPLTVIFQTNETGANIAPQKMWRNSQRQSNAQRFSVCRFITLFAAIAFFFLDTLLLLTEQYKRDFFPESRLLSVNLLPLKFQYARLTEEFSRTRPSGLFDNNSFAEIEEFKSTKYNENEQSHDSLTIRDYVLQQFSEDSEKQIRNLEFAYSSVEEMENRSARFPSIDHRIKIYMSNWYIPPCEDGARIGYKFSDSPVHATGSSLPMTHNLTLREITVQARDPLLRSNLHRIGLQTHKLKLHRRQRMFRVNSNFDGSHTSDSFDMVHFLDRSSLSKCMHKYCLDTIDFLLASMDKATSKKIPILYQFGDKHEAKLPKILYNQTEVADAWFPKIPIIQKMRRMIRPSDLQSITDDSQYGCYKTGERLVPHSGSDMYQGNELRLEPIVSKLKTQRHYGPIYEVAEADIVPWEKKKNMGIFRGELTGRYPANVTFREYKRRTPHARCRLLDRCWFVYTHATSQLVDAKLTTPINEVRMIPRYLTVNRTTTNDDRSTANQIDLFTEPISMNEILQYKAIIMLEGNDVSSGLKWALFSNSVVLMPEPTMTSWAMEELLIPWVHYIPITVSKDFDNNVHVTDAEEKVQWIMENDEKARNIANAGKLWIADLVLHPNVRNEETRIFDEMSRRYTSHFVPLTS